MAKSPEVTRRKAGPALFSPTIIGIAVAATGVLFAPRVFWLYFRLNDIVIVLIGSVVLTGSTALTLWARIALGKMWSAAPVVRERHELRTGGPYGVTRHPIYTGILGMKRGTAMVSALKGLHLLMLVVFVILLQTKLHREERLMIEAFGDEYAEYSARVPKLIPGLRAGRRRHED